MNKLVFVDTETTGLDPRIHDAYEVAWVGETGCVSRMVLPHDLINADERALEIGHYHERGIARQKQADGLLLSFLIEELRGATLVGSNPAFDAAFLKKALLGEAPWHYRLMNVADAAVWVFSWDRPRGLFDVVLELKRRGHVIPDPDHTAVGDVETTRAVYQALRYERGLLQDARGRVYV